MNGWGIARKRGIGVEIISPPDAPNRTRTEIYTEAIPRLIMDLAWIFLQEGGSQDQFAQCLSASALQALAHASSLNPEAPIPTRAYRWTRTPGKPGEGVLTLLYEKNWPSSEENGQSAECQSGEGAK